MLGKKRAVVITKAVQAVMTQAGPAQKQMELTKVFEIDTTLEELLGYLKDKDTNVLTVIFESDAPEMSRDQEESSS